MTLDSSDLEWLSLNWRKYRAQQISTSNRRMILLMFDMDYQYFPTLSEIRDGLINAQINELETERDKWTDDMNFKGMRALYLANWTMLFQIKNLGDFHRPLTPKILSNPLHPVTKHCLYLYSMESFIYNRLNRACRQKNK